MSWLNLPFFGLFLFVSFSVNLSLLFVWGQSQLQILSITSFPSVTEIVSSKIKFSKKSFRNFLSSEINYSFIKTSTDKEEINKIISSLNTKKSCAPSSIPTKVLHLQEQISNHFATICNLLFSTGLFYAFLKTVIAIHIHKKNSGLVQTHFSLIKYW